MNPVLLTALSQAAPKPKSPRQIVQGAATHVAGMFLTIIATVTYRVRRGGRGMRKKLNFPRAQRFVFWLIVVILTANLVHRIFVSSRAQAASQTPYTVVRTESGFDKAGTLRYTNYYVEALRSDGSTMWRASTSQVQQRKIFFANGDEVLTQDLLERKSTYPKRFAGAPLQRDPKSHCTSADDTKGLWVPSGEESIGGHRAARMVLTSGGRTFTAWYALDVGCALLQQRLEHETGVTVQNLTSLVVGEPDRALFQVPVSYQETPPSGLFVKIPDAVKQRLDQNYYGVRARTP